MGTHIFSGGNGEVSQVANAWTFDPAANVKLKTKGKPGTDWHKNNSANLTIPLGTIKEHGTQVVNRYGAMDTGLHNPVTVLVGLFTNVADKVNRYQTFVKTVTQEAGEMVVHGVTTLTNAILTQLSPALAQTIIKPSESCTSGRKSCLRGWFSPKKNMLVSGAMPKVAIGLPAPDRMNTRLRTVVVVCGPGVMSNWYAPVARGESISA